MEDFPKFATLKNPSSLSNEQLKIYKEAKERLKYEEPKIGFIKARLNRDNFWNLMFFLGLFLGISLALITDIMFLAWIAIIGTPWLVKKNSDITFDKPTLTFLINRTTTIKKTGGELVLLFIGSCAIMTLIGLILDGFRVENSVVVALVRSFPILLPSLYCILNNFPIAIFFTKEAWVGDGSTRPHRDSGYEGYKYSSTNYFSSSSSPNIVSNPSYRELSCNIFHKR